MCHFDDRRNTEYPPTAQVNGRTMMMLNDGCCHVDVLSRRIYMPDKAMLCWRCKAYFAREISICLLILTENNIYCR